MPTHHQEIPCYFAEVTVIIGKKCSGGDQLRIHADSGATVKLGPGSRISANRDIGVWLTGSGTALDASGLVVDGTLPRFDGNSGRGIDINGGAVAKLGDTKVIGNKDVGLAISGGSVDITSPLLVADTGPRKDGSFGRGIQVGGGSSALLASGPGNAVRVSGNAEAGLVVVGNGASVNATLVQSWGNGGRGVAVQLQAALDVGQLLSHGDGQSAVWVHGAGTVARVKHLTVVDPVGRGIEVASEGKLTALRSVVAHAAGVGAFVSGAGSQLTLVGARIVHSKPDAAGLFGHGAQSQDDGVLVLLGSDLAGAREVAVHGRVGKVLLAGVHIGKVTPLAGGQMGAGVVVSHYGQLAAAACRLEDLLGAGIMVNQAQAALDGVLVRKVAAAGATGPADALVADIALLLQANRVFLAEAARAGVLLQNSVAALQLSRIEGNAIGVASQGASVATVGAGSLVTGNGQNEASGGGWLGPALPGALVGAAVVGVSEL